MKFVTQLLLFFCIQLNALIVFAEDKCPPTDFIAAVNFLKAEGAAGIWDLYPQPFNYENRYWQLIFTAYLPNAHNNKEAIQQGTDMYRSEIVLFDPPLARKNDDYLNCYYAQLESTYFVRAYGRSM